MRWWSTTLMTSAAAIADRTGANAEFAAQLLGLQHQLFEHWHQ